MRITTSRDERPGRDGAPVITEHGTWGQPPARSPFAPPDRGAEARAWLTLLLAAVVVAWVSCAALAQLTSRAVAIPAAERGIAAVTEIDALLSLHEARLCAAASAGGSETVDLAGFPVRDVLLRAQEVPCANGVLDRAVLRDLLLSRGAELLYLRGTAAFTDPSRAADAAPALSATWLIRLLLDGLSAGLHEWLVVAAWAMGGLGALLAGIVWLLGRRGARLQRVGWALTLGALPVLFAAAGLWLVLLLLGGTGGGSLVGEFASIARSLAALPALDALLTMVAGLALVFAPRGVR
ncbi:MAG: hypothetical protein WC211_09510 [Dehalococcoidia bacterium]